MSKQFTESVVEDAALEWFGELGYRVIDTAQIYGNEADVGQAIFESGVPRVLVDPAPDNTAAIRAYDKAGFRAIDRRTSIYGPAILMVRDREHRMSFQ